MLKCLPGNVQEYISNLMMKRIDIYTPEGKAYQYCTEMIN